MRGSAVLVALLVSPLAAGCLDGIGDFVTGKDLSPIDLLGRETELAFTYQGVFDPMDPPPSPDQAYDRKSAPLTVPERTRAMVVAYDVRFDEPGPGLGFPEASQDVRLALLDPEGKPKESAAATSNINGQWEVDEPEPGTWTLSVQARGQGSVAFSAEGLVED